MVCFGNFTFVLSSFVQPKTYSISATLPKLSIWRPATMITHSHAHTQTHAQIRVSACVSVSVFINCSSCFPLSNPIQSCLSICVCVCFHPFSLESFPVLHPFAPKLPNFFFFSHAQPNPTRSDDRRRRRRPLLRATRIYSSSSF